jgi:hypothetical protein
LRSSQWCILLLLLLWLLLLWFALSRVLFHKRHPATSSLVDWLDLDLGLLSTELVLLYDGGLARLENAK